VALALDADADADTGFWKWGWGGVCGDGDIDRIVDGDVRRGRGWVRRDGGDGGGE